MENKLDQVTSGEHTILLRSLVTSNLCYLFKGNIEDAKITTSIIESNLMENQSLWDSVRELELKGKPLSKTVRKSVDNMMKDLLYG